MKIVEHHSWIQTSSGQQFHLLVPEPQTILIEDIAHALAHLCRFNGHCREFYSVAQHSVLVSRHLPLHHRLEGLLHDAAEAYLGDLVHPLKMLPGLEGYRVLEDRLLQIIAERFDLKWPMSEAVKQADLALLQAEARDLMADPPAGFFMGQQLPAPFPDPIDPWPPRIARAVFLSDFHALTGNRWRKENM